MSIEISEVTVLDGVNHTLTDKQKLDEVGSNLKAAYGTLQLASDNVMLDLLNKLDELTTTPSPPHPLDCAHHLIGRLLASNSVA